MNIDLERIVNYLVDQAPNILLALVTLIIGWRIIAWISKLIRKALEKRDSDPAVNSFLASLASVLLKVLLIFSVAGMVGIETTSFIAILAAAGFAVGMALQGSLSNFAAGVMILLFKPYKIDDIVEIGDVKAKVKDIQIFNTILQTVKNETVIIPNASAIDDKIINHSTVGNVRVDLYFHMPYEEQFNKVRSIVMDIVNNHPKILKEPKSSVDIESYESHNINVGVFVFCKPDDYWDVFYDLNNSIKPSLGQQGVKVAYSEGVELGAIGNA